MFQLESQYRKFGKKSLANKSPCQQGCIFYWTCSTPEFSNFQVSWVSWLGSVKRFVKRRQGSIKHHYLKWHAVYLLQITGAWTNVMNFSILWPQFSSEKNWCQFMQKNWSWRWLSWKKPFFRRTLAKIAEISDHNIDPPGVAHRYAQTRCVKCYTMGGGVHSA
jgi:hypothetical protein